MAYEHAAVLSSKLLCVVMECHGVFSAAEAIAIEGEVVSLTVC
jgi:hypothetical protein